MRLDSAVDAPRTLAKPAGAVADALVLTRRAVRRLVKEPGNALTALLVPLCLFGIEVGALGGVAENAFGIKDYAAFQLPVAMLFAATWSAAGVAVIMDMTTGYWDKLCLTPARRGALVVGRLLGELVSVCAYGVVLLVFGLVIGIRLPGNPFFGAASLLLMTVLFGAGYDAILLAFAMTTGSLRATQSASYFVFFPLLFMSPWLIPRSLMSDWMAIAVSFNPVTYIMEGARAAVLGGDEGLILRGVVTSAVFAGVLCGVAVAAFNRRVRAMT